MNAVNTVNDALEMIDPYDGPPEEFFLPICEELLDPVGVNMAIICECLEVHLTWEDVALLPVLSASLLRASRF